MPNLISDYELVIFDFDGVLIDSNRAKKDSFCQAASQLSSIREEEFEGCAQVGSREEILRCIIEKIREISGLEVSDIELENRYEEVLDVAIRELAKPKKLELLRRMSHNSTWAIVSAAQERWVRETVRRWFDEELFDEIIGMPGKKSSHYKRLGARERETLCFGDTVDDYEVAKEYSCDFVLLDGWSLDQRIYSLSDEISRERTLDDFVDSIIAT